MILTVSVSQLRNNISDYLDRVSKGTRVIVRDEKKGKTIAQITQAPSFDKDAFGKALKDTAGIFTAERHPEWRTKRDVINWLRKTRKNSNRTFNF